MWVRAARATRFIHENLSLKFSFSWEQYDRRLGCRLVNFREYKMAANKSKSGKKKFTIPEISPEKVSKFYIC